MVEANVVRDFTIGNTRIKIADDYCRSGFEVDMILRRIARRTQRQLSTAANIADYETKTENEKSAPTHY